MNLSDTQTLIPAIDDAAPVRWAIVGTGAIAANFASDLPLAGNAALAAVRSRRLPSAEAFAARFGGAHCFDSLDALAADTQVDAVYLATPNQVHFEAARFLLEHGKHVLVEKPITITAAEASKLAALAAQRNLLLMEALWTLFLPVMSDVRQLLSDGRLGKIERVWADLSYAKPYDPTSRFFDPALGGGALLDLGVYPLSLMVSLFGPPQTVDGTWNEAPGGVDMSARMTLGYGGFSAEIACGFHRDSANRFIIRGDKASIVIDAPFLKARRVFLTDSDFALSLIGQTSTGPVPKLVSRLGRLHPSIRSYDQPFPGHGLQFEIQAFGDALKRRRSTPPVWPLASSIEVLSIIETIKARPPVKA